MSLLLRCETRRSAAADGGGRNGCYEVLPSAMRWNTAHAPNTGWA